MLCLLIAVWFVSGAVLHFVDFPALSHRDQEEGSESIDIARVLVSPGEAIEQDPASE